MRRNKGNTIKHLNTGQMARTVAGKQNLTDAELARMLKRTQPGVKQLMKKTSVQAYIIWEMSIALKHNFFADLAMQFEETTTGAGITSPYARLAEVEKQNTDLQLQIKTLKEAIELMGRK